MKTLTVILCSLFLMAGTGYVQAQSTLKKNEAEVTFTVNIHCNNCKKKIENSLPHEKGVVDLKVTVDDREVYIKYQTGKTNKETLQKAIEKLGYTATEKTADGATTKAKPGSDTGNK